MNRISAVAGQTGHSVAGLGEAGDDGGLRARAYRKIAWRIMPFLLLPPHG